MSRLDQQIAFIQEIEKLKTVTRYNMTLDHGRAENSAEHSWHVALMAMLLYEHKGELDVDLARAIKMLLIHDLVEIGIGDTFLYDEAGRAGAHEKEAASLKRLMTFLPEDQALEISELWNEFEARETDTAKYAASLDGLQPLTNHAVTAPDGRNPHHLTVDRVYDKKSFIKDYVPDLWPAVTESVDICKAKKVFD